MCDLSRFFSIPLENDNYMCGTSLFHGTLCIKMGGVMEMGLSTIVHVFYGAQRGTPQSHQPTRGLTNIAI